MDIRTFAGHYGTEGRDVVTIHRSAPVLEQLFQGEEGSTIGYQDRDGDVVPVIETNPLDAEELTHKTLVQDGILRYQHLWLEFRATCPSITGRLANRDDAWRSIVRRLIDAPSAMEAATFGTLHDDVNFGSRTVLPFCPPDVRLAVAWNGADRAYRHGASGIPVVWPQGLIAQIDPGVVLARHALSSDIPYVEAAITMARALHQRGVTRIIGYGTGEVADAFIDIARIVGIDVVALVDSHPSQHGLWHRGLNVVSLDTAVGLGIHAYVVLSIAHAKPISDSIHARYGSEPHSPLVLDLSHAS
jgi:hypothetical protein